MLYGVSTSNAWLLALGVVLFLTYLITRSRLFAALRTLMIARYGADSWQFEGLSCPFCVGFWLSTAVSLWLGHALCTELPIIAATALGGAWLVGALITIITPED